MNRFQLLLTNMTLRAKTFMAKMQKIVSGGGSDKQKLNMVKTAVSKIEKPVTPQIQGLMESRKEIQKIIPILKKIYIDPTTRELFPLVTSNPNATIIMTSDFIDFLEIVSQDQVK